MNHFRNYLPLVAILAVIAMAALALPARADFEVKFSYGGATITLDDTGNLLTDNSTASGASLLGSTINYSANMITITNLTIDPGHGLDGNAHGFIVNNASFSTNSPGTPTVATISTSALDITNQTGVAGNNTLTITTGSTGFTAPSTNPVGLSSTAGLSADAANVANGSLVFNSYLNANNSQFGTGAGAPTITVGPVGPGASPPAGNTSTTVPLTATPYSLVQVGQYTLGNGDEFFDGAAGTSVTPTVTPTPAPTGLILVLTGMPVLVLGAWVRRRRIAASV